MKNALQNIVRIGRRILESAMNYDAEKHEIIGKIFHRCNQFRTTVEPNLNSHLNELINFTNPFVTRIIREKLDFLYKITIWILTS